MVITLDWNFICLSFCIYHKWGSIYKTLRTVFFIEQRAIYAKIDYDDDDNDNNLTSSLSLINILLCNYSDPNGIVPSFTGWGIHRLSNCPPLQLGWVLYAKWVTSPAPTLSLFTTWHCPLPLTEEKEGHLIAVEVVTVLLCWPIASALQKPRSPESSAVPLPTAVPDTSLPSSPHWGHPIIRKWSSIFLSF